MLIDLQLNPATTPWPDLLDGVLAAEDAGVDTTWVFDHLSGAVLRGHTMLECWALAGALAARTERIGIGALVANVANRPPGVLAVAAASVQAIAGGRFRLGLGAGAAPTSTWAAEQRALGMALRATQAERHAAIVEALDLLDALWAPDRDERYVGFPVPSPRPPIVLGVNGVALARLAGERADGVNVRAASPDIESLLDAARAAHAGRATAWEASAWTFWDPALLRADHPERIRLAALGVDRLVLTALAPLSPGEIAAAARHGR